MLRRRPRSYAQRLRSAVDAMPRHAREAMLRGLDSNEIIAGAYSDPGSGGVCPMLAAHRNGGRISLASFARSWDRFTGAKRPRLATRRELRTLRSYLEMSLVAEAPGESSLVAAAARIRAERERIAERERAAAGPEPATLGAEDAGDRRRASPDTGERHRASELRRRPFWAWVLPSRRYDVYRHRVAAAEEHLAEQRAAALLEKLERDRANRAVAR